MSKKTFISTGLIILILIIAAIGYYYLLYEEPVDDKDQAQEQESESQAVVEESNVPENTVPENIIIDGIFQKAEDNSMYIQVEDKEEVIKLTEETIFSEMILSSEGEIVEEKDINLSDLGEENRLSIVAFSDESNLEEKIALAVRRIIVSD